MGEKYEIYEQLSLLLQGGEHVVEGLRGFKDMGQFSLLLQPGELVVPIDTACSSFSRSWF